MIRVKLHAQDSDMVEVFDSSGSLYAVVCEDLFYKEHAIREALSTGKLLRLKISLDGFPDEDG